MKSVKRIIALVLGVLMAFSFTGCIHKKGEIAVKINGVEFTSAYYACALINAKTELFDPFSDCTISHILPGRREPF